MIVRLAAAALIWLAAAVVAAQEGADAAIERVATLADEAHRARSLAPGAREEAIATAVRDAFALDLWRAAVLGPRADELTADALQRIDAALPRYLAQLYVTRFGGDGASPPVVGETRPLRNDVLVTVEAPRGGAAPLRLHYRVRAIDGDPRVLDVVVGGVSFALLKREEFAAVLETRGVDGLVEVIEGAEAQ